MDLIKEILLNSPLLALLSGLVAYIMATRFNLYPIIIYVSKTKGLMDEPGERRVHSSKVPNLGGMGIFITFSLTLILFEPFLNNTVSDLSHLLSLLSATIILLFLGIKDDLVFITPKKKLVIQLIAVSMVCILQDVRITNFQGIFGIAELHYFISIVFSVFVFVLVINSLNLIDGIDGLAASIGILASFCFGICFFMSGYFLMTLLSAILIGSLVGFLKYNLSVDRKIFMGDTGSMIIGFLLAYQGIEFLNIKFESISGFTQANMPILLLAILSFPLFDLLRVFAIRIADKKSPFTADNNHIHHRLLRLGLSHKQATSLLVFTNLTLVLIAYGTNGLPINLSLIFIVLFGCILYLLPFLKVFEEFTINDEVEVPNSKSEKILDRVEVMSKINSVALQSQDALGNRHIKNYNSLESNTNTINEKLVRSRADQFQLLLDNKDDSGNYEKNEVQFDSGELNSK
ncbi:MraY family glycosyltransferase [Maribacter sp. X9]|uniref:MraY family glycosyltransferase n=1 Tax=Maribacter sp. X9 TaxID=3402159 RepID=UPI003AF3B852